MKAEAQENDRKRTVSGILVVVSSAVLRLRMNFWVIAWCSLWITAICRQCDCSCRFWPSALHLLCHGNTQILKGWWSLLRLSLKHATAIILYKRSKIKWMLCRCIQWKYYISCILRQIWQIQPDIFFNICGNSDLDVAALLNGEVTEQVVLVSSPISNKLCITYMLCKLPLANFLNHTINSWAEFQL